MYTFRNATANNPQNPFEKRLNFVETSSKRCSVLVVAFVMYTYLYVPGTIRKCGATDLSNSEQSVEPILRRRAVFPFLPTTLRREGGDTSRRDAHELLNIPNYAQVRK